MAAGMSQKQINYHLRRLQAKYPGTKFQVLHASNGETAIVPVRKMENEDLTAAMDNGETREPEEIKTAKPKWFKWTVEFEVTENWVADGFDLTDERASDMLANELQYAYGHELKAKVICHPHPNAIAKAGEEE